MSLPANLSALIIARIWLLLIPALVCAADSSVLARNGTVVAGPIALAGSNLVSAAGSLPLDQLVGFGGAAVTPRWIEQGVVLTSGDLLRGSVLGLQQGKFQLNSELFGLLNVPAADICVVALRPRLASWSAPQGFVGALLANGDRLSGQVSFIDELNIGIDNGHKVVSVPRERVSVVVLRPSAEINTSRQVLRIANGDRIVGQLKAWGPNGFELTSLHGTVRGANTEIASLWSEGASQRPFTSMILEGLMPGVALDRLPSGAALVSGSRSCGHGLGIRGTAKVSAQSDGTWATLVGEIVALEGRATVRVLADDKIAWDSGVLGMDGPGKTFAAPISGAKKVRVEVVPADAGESLILVGWPTLVK